MDHIDKYTLAKRTHHSEWDVSDDEMEAFEKELEAAGFNYTDDL